MQVNPIKSYYIQVKCNQILLNPSKIQLNPIKPK